MDKPKFLLENLAKDRRGASTIEYVIMLVAAITIASVLYLGLSSDDIQGKLKSIIYSAIDGKAVSENQDDSKKESGGKERDNGGNQGKEGTGKEQEPPGFFERKFNYVKKWVGEEVDYYIKHLKEEFDHALEDPIGWWFLDDLSSGLSGVDNRTGEELGFWGSLDRTFEGIPVGVGEGWKWGKRGVGELIRLGKKIDDFLVGFSYAKKKGGGKGKSDSPCDDSKSKQKDGKQVDSKEYQKKVDEARRKFDLDKGTKGKLNYELKKQDRDMRGKNYHHGDAMQDAFKIIEEETGIKKSEFKVTEWAKSKDGKSFPVEWRHEPSGAEVSMDKPHFGFDKNTGQWATGPDAPHIGWQTSGKRKGGGAKRGHILVDDVPAGRPPSKE